MGSSQVVMRPLGSGGVPYLPWTGKSKKDGETYAWRPPFGSFTRGKIQWIRYAYDIPTDCPEAPRTCPNGQRSDGRYSAQAAAEALNVNVSTIAAWCRSGRLDGIQAIPRGPWWIKLTPEIIATLHKPKRQRWLRRLPK